MLARTAAIALALTSFTVATQAATHEEEVVRSTYATLSFLCGLEPVSNVAIGAKEATLPLLEKEVSAATPVFEITNFQTGSIASIASQSWATRFSPPEDSSAVLLGDNIQRYYGDADIQPSVEWLMVDVHWGINDTYTPKRLAAIQALTVGDVVKLNASGGEGTWIEKPATYTQYATFEVTLKFQGRTVGPYTASFFFGEDANKNEIVIPQDAITGQILWNVLPPTAAYPSNLVKIGSRRSPTVNRWIQANISDTCSSARSDLCCSEDRCALPRAAVEKDLSDNRRTFDVFLVTK